MPNIVMVLGKFVAKATGPLGAPLEALIRWHDEFSSEAHKKETNNKIDRLISEFKEYSTIQNQILSVFSTISNNNDLSEIFNNARSDVNEVSKIIFNDYHLDQFRQNGVLTEFDLINEFLFRFPRTQTLLVILEQCGFPTEFLHQNAPPAELYQDVIFQLRRLAPDQNKFIFNYLSTKAPSSPVFKKWHMLFDELTRVVKQNQITNI